MTDAVIFDGFGEPMMFSTRKDENDCGSELGVYRSKTGLWKGPYENVPFVRIKFPDCSARGAGYFFKLKDGRIIRVAQDCNDGKYGAGVMFYSMEYFPEERKFAVNKVARHFPNSPLLHIGMHTFNIFGDLAVVDGYGYPNPIRRTLYRMKTLLRGFSHKKSPTEF